MGYSVYDGIEKKVAFWIEGKHSSMGIILPENPPAEEEINDFYRTIAEVAIRSEQRKQMKTLRNNSPK